MNLPRTHSAPLRTHITLAILVFLLGCSPSSPEVPPPASASQTRASPAQAAPKAPRPEGRKPGPLVPDVSGAIIAYGSGAHDKTAKCSADDLQPDLLMCDWATLPVDIGVNALGFQVNRIRSIPGAWEVIIDGPKHKRGSYLGTRRFVQLTNNHPFITLYRADAGPLKGALVEHGKFADESQTLRISTPAFVRAALPQLRRHLTP